MAETIYVIPKEGFTVPNPDARKRGEPLPAEGATVPKSPFWRKRLKDGDVTEGKAPKAAKAKSTTTKTDAEG